MKDLSRLTRSEISAIFDKARCLLRHTSLTLLCAPTPASHGRVLVITSKKLGNAPARNKIRRKIKALFYEEKLFTHMVDCVFIIKKPGMALSLQELKELILPAFAKAFGATTTPV